MLRLKEMDDMLKPTGIPGQVRSARARTLGATEDKLTAVMVFFDRHIGLFHSLLTPDIWNCERLLHHPSDAPRFDTLPITEETQYGAQETRTAQSSITAAEYEHDGDGLLSNWDQAVTVEHEMEFLQKKLDEVSRWLAALDCTEKHHSTLKLRQEGTYRWFLKTDAYKRWRTGGNHFLWLHGKAGCGKSVLVASTIEHLKNMLEDGEVVVFFYFDFQNKRTTSPTELMRSLLFQLLRHIDDRGIDPGDLPNKILEEKGEGTLSLNDLDKLCDLVSCTASCFHRDPIIVIDALDECADIEALLRVLVTLNQGNVRLLFTSRPHEEMMRHFTGLHLLSFENVAKELAADIALHVRREVDSHNQLRITDLEIKSEIHTKLNDKAEGRFRWVHCQLDTLKRCRSRVEIKEALDNLPNELEATYERILGAIDERKLEGKLARRALAWLVVALEPLRLAQIVDGLSIDFQKRELERETQWLRSVLLTVLSSLVSHSEETDVLALSHFSVKEYLTSSMALPMYHITFHEAHAEVAERCMRYISVFLKQGPTCGSIPPLEYFPVLSYVLSSGFNHIAHVDSESIAVLGALQSLGLDVRHHPSHWDRLCKLRDDLRSPYPPWPSSRHDFVLYMLIAYFSPGLLQSFLSTCHPPNPRFGTNPLVYAADLWKTQHAMVLLTCGADVNMVGLMFDDSYRASPLEVAIDLGNDVLVGELLQRGCVVTPEVLSTAVCMPWCSTRVLVKLMQTDDFVEWANEIGDEELYRGVFNGARPNAGDSKKADEDHVALARRLRQIGQDLSADSPFGVELIERAVHAAHMSMLEYLLPPDQPPPARFLLAASTGDTPETVSVVRFLLKKGVDVNAVSIGMEDTALHLAAMCPWEPRSLELAQILMHAGCNLDVRNSQGETPLIIAVHRGYLSLVEHLSCSVPFPPDILPIALRRRSPPQMIRFLIRKGADVYSTTGMTNGDTVLHLAIAHYVEPTCLDLVKIFIGAGFRPTTCKSERKTVFDVALERGYSSVVDHLLLCNFAPLADILPIALRNHVTPDKVELVIRTGAEVNSTTSNGDTVLHLAVAEYAESTSLRLIKSFIKAGCNPTICNSQGKTAFEVALESGYSSVVDHLISCDIAYPPDIIPIVLRQSSASKMVEFLIQKGADVNSTASNGDTVLHLAIMKYAQSTCLSLVKNFIKANCDPTTRNSEGKMPFEVALERGYSSVVEYLILCHVVSPPDILPIALRNRSTPQMVEFLIRKGADVNSTASNGDTVLHLAVAMYDVESTCLDSIKRLIDAGCNPTACNSEGKTVFDAALERGYTSVVEHLLLCNDLSRLSVLSSALRRTPVILSTLWPHAGWWHRLNLSSLQWLWTSHEECNCISLVEFQIQCKDRWQSSTPVTQTISQPHSEWMDLRNPTMFRSPWTNHDERGYTSVVERLIVSNETFSPDISLTVQPPSSTLVTPFTFRPSGEWWDPSNPITFRSPWRSYEEHGCTSLVQRRIPSNDPFPPNILPMVQLQSSTLADPPTPPPRRGWRDPPNPTTFLCLWTGRKVQCSELIAGDARSVINHLRKEHDFLSDGGMIPCAMITCAWGECKKLMQRESIPRHIVGCHLAIKVTCSECGMAVSRKDVMRKHQQVCRGGTKAAMEATEEGEGNPGFFRKSKG